MCIMSAYLLRSCAEMHSLEYKSLSLRFSCDLMILFLV